MVAMTPPAEKEDPTWKLVFRMQLCCIISPYFPHISNGNAQLFSILGNGSAGSANGYLRRPWFSNFGEPSIMLR